MIILGLVLSVGLLAFLCWILFQLAVFALPFFAGLTVGLSVIHGGGSPLAAIVSGLVAGVLTLVTGQLMFTLVPSTLVRIAVAVVFVAPAVVAGYHAAHGLMAIGTPSEAWRVAVGAVGAVVVGATALTRLVLRVAPSGPSQSITA